MSLTFSFASMSVYKKMCEYICPGGDEELRMDINVLKSVGTWDGDLIQKIWAQFQNQSGIREDGWQSGSSLSFYWFNKNWMPLITWPMLLLSVSASRVTSPCRVSTLRTYDSYDLRATTHCTGQGCSGKTQGCTGILTILRLRHLCRGRGWNSTLLKL